jgi:DNA-binding beta-propeller fold protein YncE
MGGILGLTAIALVLPALPASAASFVGTVAGPSIAATYPSGVEYDDFDGRLVVADTGLDRIEFYTYTLGATPATSSFTKTGQFGTHGTGNGQFDSPRDVAIDPRNGDIYVGDAGNNRVQKFDRNGSFQWATPGVGTCQTCLNTPIGVTWDAQNNILLVASTGTSLIKGINPNGTLAWKSPTGTQLGVASPRDAARGPDGRLWIDDYHHHQVKAYNVSADGLTWNATPVIVLGDGLPAGHGAGQLNYPYNMDFSLDGKTVYVADTGNNRVGVWTNSGTNATPNWGWAGQIGGNCPQQPDPCADPPADLGSIDTLRRVVVDPVGNLITADFWGNGLQVWRSDGSAALEIELYAAPAPGFAQSFGVAVSPAGAPNSGSIVGVDRLNQRVELFNSSGTYVRSGGSRGTALRFLSWPEAAAFAPDGTVWVGDTRNDRIVHWKADMSAPVTSTSGAPNPPSLGTGSAVGQFSYIEDLDVGADGRVWVADTDNSRIQVYNPSTKAFTAYGSLGTGQARFDHPQGIAIASAGVFVADTNNNRIQKLDLSGNFLASYTGVSAPQGVAVDPSDGTVWVADTGNNRILHLSANLQTVLDQISSYGAGNTPFNDPHTLAVYGTTLYVADSFNNSIVKFDISTGGGGFNPSYSSEISDPGGVAPLYPAGGATASNGDRYLADSGGSRIVRVSAGGTQTVVSPASAGWNDPRDIDFDSQDNTSGLLWVANTSASTVVELKTDGTVMNTFTGFKTPYGLSNDSTGVYVADTYQVVGSGTGRIVKISKANGSVIWSQNTCGGTAFKRPRDAAVGSDGRIYVADTDNNRIVVLNASTGACIGKLTLSGGTVKAPRSLVSDTGGGLWIADAGNYRVAHFSNAGAFLGASGSFGEGTNQFRSAHCVFLDGSHVDVCDTFNYRVQRYTVNGSGVPVFGDVVGGTKPTNGGFNGAFDAAFDTAGNLYAVDWFNHRIEKFDQNGNFLTSWGGYGSKTGSLIFPRGVVYNPNDSTVVVTDSENNRIDVFTPSGSFVKSIKPSGTTLFRPYATAIGPSGTYWVADTQHNRVLRLDGTGAVLANSGSWSTTLKAPKGIAVDSGGNVYISDSTSGGRVREFSAGGTLLKTLSTSGTGNTNVKNPQGLRISGSGTSALLLIADTGNDRIVVLKLDGSPVATFGSTGSGAGQFDGPYGVDRSPATGDIAVADFPNNRLSMWTT